MLDADADPMLALLGQMLQLLMEAEVSALCGAKYGVRSAERANHRNGYRERLFHTRLGSIDLAISKLRKGIDFPSLLEAGRRQERAFVQGIGEAGRIVSKAVRIACAMADGGSPEGLGVDVVARCTHLPNGIGLTAMPGSFWGRCATRRCAAELAPSGAFRVKFSGNLALTRGRGGPKVGG